MLYAVGGRDDTTELNSVEKYNPMTNTWSTVVAMISRRSGVSLYSTLEMLRIDAVGPVIQELRFQRPFWWLTDCVFLFSIVFKVRPFVSCFSQA